MFCYLCGSIEFAADKGKLWRRKIRPFIEETLRHRVYDPAEDERKNLTDEEVAHFRSWKQSDPERFRQTVRRIINFDLDLIQHQADYLVCFWDSDSGRGGGTAAELTAAYRKGIPVYLVTELPLDEVSGWVLACADRVFANFEGLKAFLQERYEKKTPGDLPERLEPGEPS
ncbi:MAG TPA: hypothetical protein VIG89_03060 [Candidatus Acidoferrales bacterium]